MGALHPKQLHGSVGGSGIAIGSEIGEIRLYRHCSPGCGDCDPHLHYPCANRPRPASGYIEWLLGRVLWLFSCASLSQTVRQLVKRLATNRASFSEDDERGVSAIRHGLCWGNENRGDTLIVPWRGCTRCLNAGPLASCGLTIGSGNNTRDRVAQPRFTRHRVDLIESFPEIYHMPCLGRVSLSEQMKECACGAERGCCEIRSLHSHAIAKQTAPSCSGSRQLPGHIWMSTLRRPNKFLARTQREPRWQQEACSEPTRNSSEPTRTSFGPVRPNEKLVGSARRQAAVGLTGRSCAKNVGPTSIKTTCRSGAGGTLPSEIFQILLPLEVFVPIPHRLGRHINRFCPGSKGRPTRVLRRFAPSKVRQDRTDGAVSIDMLGEVCQAIFPSQSGMRACRSCAGKQDLLRTRPRSCRDCLSVFLHQHPYMPIGLCLISTPGTSATHLGPRGKAPTIPKLGPV